MVSFRTLPKHSIHYNKPSSILSVSKFLYDHLIKLDTNITILCIGTDRSTGDSYGPLTGTMLTKSKLNHFNVLGTLNNPVHALNIRETIQSIYQLNPNTFIIAIDASLGQKESIGHLVYGFGSIKPGKAVKKDLPSVGDLYITSIVNIGGLMEFTILQNTRLSLVYKLADKTTKILQFTDYYLSQGTNHSLLSSSLNS